MSSKTLTIDLENLTCPICLEIFETPTSVQCGHTFCRGCISTAVETKAKCPTCQKNLCEFIPKKNLIINEIIMKLFPERAQLENRVNEILNVIQSQIYRKYATERMHHIKKIYKGQSNII